MANHITKGTGIVGQNEADQMFFYWMECGGSILEVAKRFDRNRKTIYSVKARCHWDEKKVEYEKEKTRRVASEIGREDAKDIKIVRAMQRAVAQRLGEKLKANGYDATVQDFVRLTRLALEIEGELPTEGHPLPNNVTVNIGDMGNGDSADIGDMRNIFARDLPRSRFDPNDN